MGNHLSCHDKEGCKFDLEADTITNLMIWAIEKMAPLKQGNGLFSERKMCAPARLGELVSLRNPALEWAHRIMSLDRKMMPSEG